MSEPQYQPKYCNEKNKKISLLLFLSIALSLSCWGVGTVLYWEVWKGFKPCKLCEWHRILYSVLFLLSLVSIRFHKQFLRLSIIAVVGMEIIISTGYVINLCRSNICRYISVPNKINLILVLVSFFVLIFSNWKLEKKS